MGDDLGGDIDELDEVTALVERMVLAATGSADLAVFVLLAAAMRVQETSGEPDEAFEDIYRLMGLRLERPR